MNENGFDVDENHLDRSSVSFFLTTNKYANLINLNVFDCASISRKTQKNI